MNQQYFAGWTVFDPQNFDYSNGVTAVNDMNNIAPILYSLNQNYPNPFNPSTAITFAMPASGQVSLKVYDILGCEVATLVNGMQEAGTHTAYFNANTMASGIYFYKLSAGNFNQVRKMLFVK